MPENTPVDLVKRAHEALGELGNPGYRTTVHEVHAAIDRAVEGASNERRQRRQMSKTLIEVISQVTDDPDKRIVLMLQIRKELAESLTTSTANDAPTFTAKYDL